MTWSILARDAGGAFGIAIASKFFAVGALCPHARSGVGALATQALVNPTYARPGLDLLAEGTPAAEVVGRLTAADAGRASRQRTSSIRKGAAPPTPAPRASTCGHLAGRALFDRGQHARGTAVLAETARAYDAPGALPFAERLLAALEAGDAAGGDKRGSRPRRC